MVKKKLVLVLKMKNSIEELNSRFEPMGKEHMKSKADPLRLSSPNDRNKEAKEQNFRNSWATICSKHVNNLNPRKKKWDKMTKPV